MDYEAWMGSLSLRSFSLSFTIDHYIDKVNRFDVVKYIRDQMAALRAGGGTDDDGLKIASGSGKVQEVEIHMADDEDDEERKRLREKRAEEKRMQNLMPTWHTTSTITGEKTALGIKAAAESSNRAILDSLDAQAKAAEAKKKSFDTEGLAVLLQRVSLFNFYYRH